MKKCSKCGMEMQDENQVCSFCGEQLEAVETTEVKEVVEVNEPEDIPTVFSGATVSEPEQKPGNKKKIGIIAGGIAVVAAIGVAAAVFVKPAGPSKDPKEAVMDAFKSVYKQENTMPMTEIFAFGEIFANSRTQNTENELSLKLEGTSDYTINEFAGSGFSITGRSDVKNKKFSSALGVQFQGMELAHADIYMDEQMIMAAVPELSSKVFSINYADDLEGQIKNSPLLSQFIEEEDFDFSVASDYMDYVMSYYGDEQKFDVMALWDRYKTGSKAMDDFKAAMTVEMSEKASCMVDGSLEECQGYDVVIKKDAVITYFRTSADFFLKDETLKKDIVEYFTQVINLTGGMYGSDLYELSPEEMQLEAWEEAEDSIGEFLTELEGVMDDVTMKVYVDKKGQLAAVTVSTTLNTEEDFITVTFDAELKGGYYLTQNVDMTLLFDDGDSEIKIALSKEGSYDKKSLVCNMILEVDTDWDEVSMVYAGTYDVENGDYSLKFQYIDEYTDGSLTIDGMVTDLAKGKSFDAIADNIAMSIDGEEIFRLSGHYGIKPLEGEVNALEGDILDVLAATEEQWQAVGMEIVIKAMSLSQKLQ